jgi:uncharacterized membrane protein YphA (DoxX/SURF4 family)
MLNTFPHLLVYAFYAPTIIRVAVALAFFYVAYVQLGRRDEIAKMRFLVVGETAWAVWVSVAFFAIVGAMLLFGYYTQIAAILAVLALIKCFILKKWYPRLIPLSHITILLLAVMCLSLLISGAGALAQDLPL